MTSPPTDGLSINERREVQRAILSQASIAAELRPRAADQALVLAVTLPIATAQSTLLSVGIIGSQVVGLASADSLVWFRIVLIAVLVVTAIIVIVVLRRNLVRVRRSLEALDTEAA